MGVFTKSHTASLLDKAILGETYSSGQVFKTLREGEDSKVPPKVHCSTDRFSPWESKNNSFTSFLFTLYQVKSCFFYCFSIFFGRTLVKYFVEKVKQIPISETRFLLLVCLVSRDLVISRFLPVFSDNDHSFHLIVLLTFINALLQ